MSSHALVQSALTAHAGLTGLVGDRIRPDLARESDTYPFIVFKRSALDPIRGIDNTRLGTRETFDIECWDTTRGGTVDVSEQAMLALEAADLPPDLGDPDAIDPEGLERCIVLRVDIFT